MKEREQEELESLMREVEATQFESPLRLIEVAKEALELAKRIDDREAIVRCLNSLSYGYQVTGSYAESFEKVVEALGCAQRYELAEMRLNSLNRLASLLSDLEDEGAALITLNSVIKEWVPSMDQRILMRTYVSMGTCYLRLNVPDEAVERLAEALSMASAYGDERMMYWCIHSIGIANAKRERYDEAISNYRSALNYYKETRQLYNMTAIDMLLGEAYLRMKDYASADIYLKSALEEAEKHGFQMLSVETCCFIADLYDQNEQYPLAEEYLRLAVNASPANPTDWQTILCDAYSRHHEKMGNLPSALKYCRLSLQASKKKTLSRTIAMKSAPEKGKTIQSAIPST